MKKVKFTLGIFLMIIYYSSIMLVSCGPSEAEMQDSVGKLQTRSTELRSDISSLEAQKSSKTAEIAELDKKLKELKICASGKKPKYILKIHLKQSHFSLSIKKHIKDAMNAIDFEMPVDKDFYDQVSTGTKIVDKFRAGSFILYGSFGDWNMTVTEKLIRE